MTQTIRNLPEQVENRSPDAQGCVAEADEAFAANAANIAQVGIIENARTQSRIADSAEAVELDD